MPATADRSRRRRAARSPSHDSERPRPGPAGGEWPGPSRRARTIAAALAIAFAVLTFAIVSHVWRGAAPPPKAVQAPSSVEVTLVPARTAPVPASPVPPAR